jgi:multidrug transporter EmrE-like cation transporter
LILGNLYNRGNLTIIYSVFRGMAPVFVAILSIVFLKDLISLGVFWV